MFLVDHAHLALLLGTLLIISSTFPLLGNWSDNLTPRVVMVEHQTDITCLFCPIFAPTTFPTGRDERRSETIKTQPREEGPGKVSENRRKSFLFSLWRQGQFCQTVIILSRNCLQSAKVTGLHYVLMHTAVFNTRFRLAKYEPRVTKSGFCSLHRDRVLSDINQGLQGTLCLMDVN